MEPFFGSFLGITLWLSLLAFWAYKCYLRYKEREMDLRAMGRLPQTASRQSSVEMRRLGEELARLRETSTAYDLTVERELKALRERVVLLETILRDSQSRPASALSSAPAKNHTARAQGHREPSDNDAIPLSLR